MNRVWVMPAGYAARRRLCTAFRLRAAFIIRPSIGQGIIRKQAKVLKSWRTRGGRTARLQSGFVRCLIMRRTFPRSHRMRRSAAAFYFAQGRA